MARLLKRLGLQALQPQSFRPRTAQRRPPRGDSPHLPREAPPPSAGNQVGLGDSTSVPLGGNRFASPAPLRGPYARRIVGWESAEHMAEPLVLAALRQARTARQPGPGLIHRADRGGPRAGGAYRGVLGRARMRQSMSRAGDVYGNAFRAPCFGTTRTEPERAGYATVPTADAEIRDCLGDYDTKRRHSSPGYLTPCAFELSQK